MLINISVDDILENAERIEKKELYDGLKDEVGDDLEDSVSFASEGVRQRIFDELISNGFGDNFVEEECIQPTTIENKRYMMDKEDDDMLTYLIEKYKYFG